MITSLLLSCFLAVEPYKPFTIEIEGKKYRAVIIEEVIEKKAEPTKTPPKLGWNWFLDKPKLTNTRRKEILENMKKRSGPLYNFRSEELQAMDEEGFDESEDYGTKEMFEPKPQSKTKTKENKKEKMVWMEFGGAYIQVPESDYENRHEDN